MPELPEVETTKSSIAPVVLNKFVKSVKIYQPKLRWQIPDIILQTLPNRKITSIERRAKYILLNTNAGSLIIHLGMTGCLKVVNADTPLVKHDHFEITLKSGDVIRYNDPRKFGCILWATDPHQHNLLNKLGPEPLTKDFNAKYLYDKCQKSSKAIKSLLMDNATVVGVGNIYATESLYIARILPQRAASSITMEEAKLLTKEIKKILKKAISLGGTTLKDFYSPEGKPGYFKQALLVYGRKGENCYACDTILSQLIIGQRSTVYCKSCQQ